MGASGNGELVHKSEEKQAEASDLASLSLCLEVAPGALGELLRGVGRDLL